MDGDGVIDRTTQVRARVQPVPLNYKRLNSRYSAMLDVALSQNTVAIEGMKVALRAKESAFQEDQIEQYFRDHLSGYREAAGIGRRIHDSREGERYYQDLIRERYFVRLEKSLAGQPSLQRLQKLYTAGDYWKFAEQSAKSPLV